MKRRLQHRSAVAGLALALALGVVGCSDDAPPAGSPVPSNSSSATATASVPALPDEARGRGPEAAEAFVRHYVDLINYGLRTLDSEPMRTASAPTCDLCLGFAQILDRVHTRGGSYEGGQWTIDELTVRPQPQSDEFNVQTLVQVRAEKIREKANGSVMTHPERKAVFSFVVSGGSQWRVVRLIGGAQ